MGERLTSNYLSVGVGVERVRFGRLRSSIMTPDSLPVLNRLLENPYVYFAGVYAVHHGTGKVQIRRDRVDRGVWTEGGCVPGRHHGTGMEARIRQFIYDSMRAHENPDLTPANLYLVDRDAEALCGAVVRLHQSSKPALLAEGLRRFTGIVYNPRIDNYGRDLFGTQVKYMNHWEKLPSLLGLTQKSIENLT